ncbi:sprT domain-containing protein [Pseudomonas aeruginosa]|nr:sprT domain-containing protein [Pseudomonas aeruginosa]
MLVSHRRPTEEAYAELQAAYDFYNDHLFASQERLPACLITYQREKRTMGYFSQARFIRRDGIKADEIAMNPDYFAVIPLVEILQTLVHEMVHLWQYHFGKPSRACYHNTEWANKMEALGLMPSDTGKPGGKRVGQSMNDYVIPGGRFDVATRELLKRGFAISWMDRFPVDVRGPSRPMSLMPASLMPPASQDYQGDDDLDAGVDEIADELDPAIALAYQAPAAVASLDVSVRQPGDRSNRLKYSCPGCRLNMWGKPGLKVICEESEERLVVLELSADSTQEALAAD